MFEDTTFTSVLVVDDEPDNLTVVAETLAYMGLAVRSARNGHEGLNMLLDFVPDVILLDLSMPQMDGWEMCAQLKANPYTASIPVIALSAHAMAGDMERALAGGFDGYLSKPIEIMSLMENIQRALVEGQALAARLRAAQLRPAGSLSGEAAVS